MDLTGRDLTWLPTAPAHAGRTGHGPAASTAPQVALEVRLGSEDEVVIPQSVSPDSDYFWLDLVTAAPVHLTPGEQTIRYGYAGEESSNPGSSKVDAFYLQPAVAQRVWQTPDGRTISLRDNTVTGEVTWLEE